MAPEIVVSFSALKDWRHCRQLHYYRRVRNLSRRLRPVPFKLGTLVHEGVEAYLMEEDWRETVIAAARTEWEGLMMEEQDYYGDMPTLVEGIMERYVAMYPGDPAMTLATELSFGDRDEDDYPPVELMPGLLMKGRIDWVVEDPDRGTGIIDHKSAKSQLPDEEFRLTDLQTAFYQRGWNNTPELVKEMGEAEWVGFNYILTKPPTIPEVTQKGALSQRAITTTEAVILATAAANEIGPDDPSVLSLIEKAARPESEWFSRKILTKPDYLVDNLLDEVSVIAREMVHLTEYPYRNPGRHCSNCEFYPLCSAELMGLDTDFILKSDYTTKEVKANGSEAETEDGE